MKNTLIFISALCFSLSAIAQTVSFGGRVITWDTERAVDSAFVILEPAKGEDPISIQGQVFTQIPTYTTVTGEYYFTQIPSGSYRLKIVARGYHPFVIENLNLNQDKYEFPNVKLSPLYRRDQLPMINRPDSIFYESGELRGFGEYKLVNIKYNGVKVADEVEHGTWTYLNKDGKTHEIQSFKKGLPHGEYRLNYDNGKRFIVGEFKNGVRTGQWTYYFENGKMNYYSSFKDGVEIVQYPNWARNKR